MSRIKHLQLVLPQALTQLRSSRTEQSSSVLLEWLKQAKRQRLWGPDDLQHARLDPWQHSLLHALPPDQQKHGLASAHLQWRGEGGTWFKGSCLHVELVHLQAGLDDLRLLVPPAPSAEEETQLLASLQPLLSLAGFELQQSSAGQSGRWYLSCERLLSLNTYSPRAGFATRIYDVMPQGADGAELRRLMTEAQMLLHDHPVNQQRNNRGVPALNALWCWGAGQLELVSQTTTQRVLSNEAYVQGLCEHLHISCWPLPPHAEALLGIDAEQVLLVLPADLATLESIWLQPLQTALLRGDIEQLDVHLDHWRLRIQGGRWRQLRRFMSRNRSDLTDILS